MRANNMTSTVLQSGKNYFVPESRKAYGDQSAVGQWALDTDNARKAREAAHDNSYNQGEIDRMARRGLAPPSATASGSGAASLPEIEIQPRYEGGVTKAVNAGWREAFNRNNTGGHRLISGALASLGTPNMMVESMLYAPFNVTPAARETGQYIARAVLQSNPEERNMDILRAISTGAEAFTNAGAAFPSPNPRANPNVSSVKDYATIVAESTGVQGRSGFELRNAPYQNVRNEATQINGRDFSGHALDQMQNRGVMPSVVENALSAGTQYPTRIGTTGFYDSINNIRVIVNSESGRVVTVIRGAPK